MKYTLIAEQPGIYQTPGDWQWHRDADLETEDGDIVRVRVYGDLISVDREFNQVLSKLTSEGEG